MSNDRNPLSSNITLRQIGAGVVAFVFFISMLWLASPADSAEVCPEQNKVESIVDGDIDSVVLEAGTRVCIKGGQVLVNLTADGTSTLFELLGTGQNVSHYSVLEVPSSTTTTTTVVETTTTTTNPSTTSTSAPTTTVPNTSTIPTTETTVTPTTQEAPSTTQQITMETLPFTGSNNLLNWALFGVALGILGWTLVWFASEDDG